VYLLINEHNDFKSSYVHLKSNLSLIIFQMIDFFVSRYDLESAFVEEQMQEGSVSNCIPESLIADLVMVQGQDIYQSVDDLKLGIDENFVDHLGDQDQQVADIKQIISLLEAGTNKELMEPEVFKGAFTVSNKKVIKNLQDILLKQLTPKKFCDHYTPEKIREAVENRPRKLWGKLLHEGTNTILFSDNGVGKTQLCMMIADGIAKGESTIFGLEVETPAFPRVVVYYDFEMTESMLLKRYGFNSVSDIEGIGTEELKTRLPQFIRYDLISMQDDLIGYGYDSKTVKRLDRTDLLFLHIECCMMNYVPFNIVFVIDNITSVSSKLEDNGTAQDFMNGFIELKQKYGGRFTSIILAHTPKVPRGGLLQKEHVKGAKSLTDLADEVIGLGQSSQSENLFYLKQFKGRVDGKDYDEDNVLIFERSVTESGVLTLKVMDKTEREVLHIKTAEATRQEIEEATSKMNENIENLIKDSFVALDDFPDGTSIPDRVNYIFNSSEISDVIFENTEERIPARLITKVLREMDVKSGAWKIGTNQNKKGHLLELIIKSID